MNPADLAGLPESLRQANGVPEPARAAARERAADLVRAALPDAHLRVSCLGPAWSSDLDVHVRDEPPAAQLTALGWLPLDALLARIGSPGRGRWLVTDGDVPLAMADLKTDAPPEPVPATIARARRRGEVRLREALELLALREAGHRLPAGDRVVQIVLERERRQGPDPSRFPVPVGGRRVRRLAARARPRPRLVIALSGVDGAGKSTLARLLADDLAAVGVPVERVWTRPGMRLGLLARAARLAKRALREDTAPGIRRVARGAEAGAVRSRRGTTGWAWSLLVTLAFLADVRRRHLRARGVLVYDRHLLDAIATLRFGYAGSDTRLQEALVRALLPRAHATFYLDTSAELALARKDDPLFGEHAVRRQLELYATLLDRVPGVHRLDAARPARGLAHEVLRTLTAADPG